MTKVLVTGASGYIAKHIVLQLLLAGYEVRASVRSKGRADQLLNSMRAHLNKTADAALPLTFVELDLNRDAGWPAAMQDIDVLMHTASPFPLDTPGDEEELIRPAVDGTLRALQAAVEYGVKRIVLTSSTAAVVYRPPTEAGIPFDESHWSVPDHPACNAYGKSKTLAELAAWEFIETQAAECNLTTINPGLAIGPALDSRIGTSLQVLQRLLLAKDPALPKIGFACVDVRDVATAHVRAIDRPATYGKRILAVSQFVWFHELAMTLSNAYPDRRIPTRLAPSWLIKFLAVFNKRVAAVVPNLEVDFNISNQRAIELLGIDFQGPEKSVLESARFLIDNDLV
ncbi:MAG: NAD-dependent epimerase/dehydratase family protein [Rhizobiaceae bacterium]|nr:NAD-dependent epimerase/dehydratase family protein [Rhizobiaceae bacterium]